jgi:hypothetical protein
MGDVEQYQNDVLKRVSMMATRSAPIDTKDGQAEAKGKHPGLQAIDRRASRGSIGPLGPGDAEGSGSREPEVKFGSASAGPVVRKGRQFLFFIHLKDSD